MNHLFERLKNARISASVLCLLDTSCLLIIKTDTSTVTCGVKLYPRKNGSLVSPTYFASFECIVQNDHSPRASEKSRRSFSRFRTFRVYLLLHYELKIITNHKELQSAVQKLDTHGHSERWRKALGEYNFILEYHPACQDVAANFLFRQLENDYYSVLDTKNNVT